jgi:hypothetical protein
LPVGVSLHQLQQLRIDLDVELGPGQRPQSAVPQAIGASFCAASEPMVHRTGCCGAWCYARRSQAALSI